MTSLPASTQVTPVHSTEDNELLGWTLLIYTVEPWLTLYRTLTLLHSPSASSHRPLCYLNTTQLSAQFTLSARNPGSCFGFLLNSCSKKRKCRWSVDMWLRPLVKWAVRLTQDDRLSTSSKLPASPISPPEIGVPTFLQIGTTLPGKPILKTFQQQQLMGWHLMFAWRHTSSATSSHCL